MKQLAKSLGLTIVLLTSAHLSMVAQQGRSTPATTPESISPTTPGDVGRSPSHQSGQAVQQNTPQPTTAPATTPPAKTAPPAKSRPKIGLALGGGAALGLAHIGVLR